jgi:hypothetical protein
LRTNKKSWIKCAKPVLVNLVLWMQLLGRANTGISMNLIVTCRPNRIVPIRAWGGSLAIRLEDLESTSPQGKHAPPKRPDQCNLLKFVGMAVNIWLECLQKDDQDCILSVGNNTSAVGWLCNSSRLNTKLVGSP